LGELVEIYDEGVSLVVTSGGWSAAQQKALDACAAAVSPFEFVKQTDVSGQSLEYALPWFEDHLGGLVWLDLARPLARMFAELFETNHLGARLTLSPSPMCPRFHVDRVVCRLVVSFSGPGSEFLADEDVRRSSLGAKDDSVERPGTPIHRLKTGEVGLLKGESWPRNAGRGIVHRSPAGQERRLVMTLDLL
jgi:hypothetical protein